MKKIESKRKNLIILILYFSEILQIALKQRKLESLE